MADDDIEDPIQAARRRQEEILRCHLMPSYRKALYAALNAYLEEFGDEYNRDTFIDYATQELIAPFEKGGGSQLAKWYRRRADELERAAGDALIRSRVADLVEDDWRGSWAVDEMGQAYCVKAYLFRLHHKVSVAVAPGDTLRDLQDRVVAAVRAIKEGG